MGALVATVVGLYIDLPAPVMLPLLLIAALAGGAGLVGRGGFFTATLWHE